MQFCEPGTNFMILLITTNQKVNETELIEVPFIMIIFYQCSLLLSRWRHTLGPEVTSSQRKPFKM